MAAYQADRQRLLTENESAAQAVEALRNQYFLAWDDDSGAGYAASLAFDVPAEGDYVLIAGSSLSALGRSTFGDYELLVGLDSPASRDGAADPSDAPIAERLPGVWGLAASVEEAAGSLTTAAPTANLKLVDLDAGQVPQAIVTPGEWQAARTLGEFTLVGCTVSPAFDFAGFELAPPDWQPG